MKPFFLMLMVGLNAVAGPAQDFCQSELVSSLMVMRADRENSAKEAVLKAHLQQVLDQQGLDETPFSTLSALPFDAFQEKVSDYLRALEEPVRAQEFKKELLEKLQELIAAQTGDPQSKAEMVKTLLKSEVTSLSRLLKVMETLPTSSQKYHQRMLSNACGPDGMARGGIAFEDSGNRHFAFCPGALLLAMLEETEDGISWRKEMDGEALWFTAFHEMGHVLGANPSSPYRKFYQPLVKCMEKHSAPIASRYQDEAIADFWGAVGLASMISDPSISETKAVEIVAKNLAPFRQGSMFSPHHLPFGARLQVVKLELCRELEKRPLEPEDCRLHLSQP